MTISTTVRRAGPYTGNGVTVAFSFGFKVFATSDVLVVQTVLATATDTTKTLTTDYTVSLNADQNVSPGGVVTMLVAPPTGTTLTIGSVVAKTQPVNLTNLGGFYPTVVNDEFDRLTILVQQLAEQADRSPQISISTGLTLPLLFPSPLASYGIVWNASGTALINGALPTAPTSAFMATVLDDASAVEARATLAIPGPTSSQSTSFSVVSSDRNKLFLVSTSAGAVTVTLLSAATAGDGFGLSIKKTSTDYRLISVVEGSTNIVTVAEFGDAVVLRSDGTTWRVESELRAIETSPSFNGDFEIAQRGTSFPLLSTGTHVTDRTIAGPGNGGQITFQQLAFAGSEVQIPGKPHYFAQIDWTTAPTSGEGRSGYTAFFAVVELRHEDVYRYRGRRVTISAMVRFPIGSNNKVYLYVSMGMGVTGNHGQSGNTISGTGAGVDRNTSVTEILYRSAGTVIGTSWQLVQATFDLDALTGATIASDNVLTIGVGADYSDIALNDQMQITVLHLDFGSVARPMPHRPIAERLPQAHRHLYYANQGVVGVAISATTIQCAINFPTIMPGVPAITLLTSTPIFRVANNLVTGVGSVITVASATTRGALVTIDGFTGMTAGQGAVYANTSNLLRIESN